MEINGTPIVNGKRSLSEEAVVIVDPNSSGAYLKEYVRRSGRKVIALFTLTDKEWQHCPGPTTIKKLSEGCNDAFQSKDTNEALAYLRQSPWKLVAIIPGSESGVGLADSLAEKLNLPGNSPNTAARRRNKLAMREACKENGLACPDFRLCQTNEQAVDFARRHTFPVMVKTLEGANSQDVHTCHSVKDVQKAFDQIVGRPDPFGKHSTEVLIEEFLEGPQYWVDVFAVDGKVYDLGCYGRSYFHENGAFSRNEYCTLHADQQQQSRFIEYATAVARAVGLIWGPAFVEFRDVKGKGPVLIEVNSRIPGASTPYLLKGTASPEFDLIQATLDVYLSGRNFSLPPIAYNKDTAVLFMRANVSGTISHFKGLADIKRLPSYLSHTMTKARGQLVQDTDVVLQLNLAHSCHEQLQFDIMQAEELLEIQVDELKSSL